MPKLSEKDVTSKIRKLLAARDEGKAAYSRADELLDELVAGGLKPDRDIPLPGGRVARLVDQFKAKNKVFKPTGISRFEIQVSHAKPG
jgi:hypothetical protein